MRGLLLLAVLLASPRAQAGGGFAAPPCTIKGKHALDTVLHSQPQQGVELAKLARWDWLVEIDGLPADSIAGRVHVRARRDTPSLRVDGYVSAAHFSFYAQKEIPVVPPHVSINARTWLRLFHPDIGTLEAEPRAPSLAHSRAPVACGDIGLVAPPYVPRPPPKAPPRSVRLKGPSASLYDSANGKVVFQLVSAQKESPVFDAFETVGGFEHVRFDADVHVDGWVREADLRPRKDDDAYGMGGLGLTGASAASFGGTKFTARLDTEVRLGTDAGAPLVGVLEKGARVRATNAEAGFSRVILVDGAATPPTGKSFFVRTLDLES